MQLKYLFDIENEKNRSIQPVIKIFVFVIDGLDAVKGDKITTLYVLTQFREVLR